MICSRVVARCFNCLTVAVLTCVVTASVPAVAVTPFVHETVDATGPVGQATSLGLDAGGTPHITYTNLNLRYAVKTGGSWSIETVDATGDVGRYTSLELDAQGNPHISY